MRAASLCLLAVLLPTSVLARSWNGVEPGVTTKEEVLKRFGAPSKTLSLEGHQVLAYNGTSAIKGTAEAQFRIEAATGLVDRIDVFPGPVVDRETVESSYGPPCPTAGPAASSPCFQKKLTEDFRTYYLYPRLGMAVFFDEEGDKVKSFVFQSVKSPHAP